MAESCCSSTTATCCAPPTVKFPEPAVSPADTHAHGTAGDTCCPKGVPVFDGVDPRYKRILWTVIAINGAMFVIEMVAGQLAGSQALQGGRPRLPRRHRHLRPEPGGDRREPAHAGHGGARQGRDLFLMALWVFGSTRLSVADPRHAAGRGHGRDRLPGAGRQPGLGAAAAALQGRRRQRALGLAVLAQRRDRQRRRDGAALGVWGTATAWPDLLVAAVMAGHFPHVLGADPPPSVGGVSRGRGARPSGTGRIANGEGRAGQADGALAHMETPQQGHKINGKRH